jgi:hypothetical protein
MKNFKYKLNQLIRKKKVGLSPLCTEYLSSLRSQLEELSSYDYSLAEISTREYEESANTSLAEFINLFRSGSIDKFPIPSPNSKFEEFSNLRAKKQEIASAINDHNETLTLINLANKLDKELPEPAKKNNSYVKELEKEYPAFFDEDSGNSTKQGLKEIEDYICGEKKSLNSELSRVDHDMKKLLPESDKDNEMSKNPSKRAVSESDDYTQPSSKKISRSEDNDNNRSDPSQSNEGTSQSDVGTSQSDVGTSQSDVGTSQSDVGSF